MTAIVTQSEMLRSSPKIGLDDGVRVGLWFPHGRCDLPLAAMLCAKGIPGSSVVWESDEAVPDLPQVEVSLWLVLCKEDPPEPPIWRDRRHGVWAVFPGSAARWTEATRGVLDRWCVDWVLIDLLPDEILEEKGMERWRGVRLAWLPAWFPKVSDRVVRDRCSILSDEDFDDSKTRILLPAIAAAMELKAEPLSCAVIEWSKRVLLWTSDPVWSGAVLRLGEEEGLHVVSVGSRKLSMFRRLLLGGVAERYLDYSSDSDRLSDFVSSVVKSMDVVASVSKAAPVPEWNWEAWLKGLSGADDIESDPSIAADFLISLVQKNGGSADTKTSRLLDDWFRSNVGEMWNKEWSAKLKREVKASIWLLNRASLLEVDSMRDEHLLARLYSAVGDVVSAEETLARYAMLNGGLTRELPGSIAIWLWHRGLVEHAQRILDSWATGVAPTAIASFVLGVACDLCGRSRTAERHIESLLKMDSGFLDCPDATDARWILAAVIARVYCCEDAAVRFRSLAERQSFGSEHFFDLYHHVPLRSDPPSTSWKTCLMVS